MSDRIGAMDDLSSEQNMFEFAEWRTPFENEFVEILEITYTPMLRWETRPSPLLDRSLFHAPATDTLVIRLLSPNNQIFRVSFDHINAFRVLDEHGLMQFWEKTKELGGRPAHTTFRVRNHLWSTESPISFLTGATDGWSFMLATRMDCIEIIALEPPMITVESDSR